MAEITVHETIKQLLAVLREGFMGADKWSYFVDHGTEAGLLQFLPKLSAEEASRSWGGTSIAAHVYHVIFGLEATTAWISGDRTRRDWPSSWRVSTVDEEAWQSMVDDLRSGYETLRQAIETQSSGSVEAMGGAISGIAHVAYHLGAIRQKLAHFRQDA